MKEEVYNLIIKSSFREKDLISLAGHLHVDTEAGFKKLTKALFDLTKEGKIYRDKDGFYHQVSIEKNIVKGHMDLKSNGFGFIIVDDGEYPDIYIPRSQTKTAMDDDYCLVEITKDKGKGKMEGKVIKVLERSVSLVVGEYYEGQIFPKNYTNDIVYKLQKKDWPKVLDHQLIQVKIINYNNPVVKQCKLVSVIGHVELSLIHI